MPDDTEMTTPVIKERIAILGGGPAALTTAFELSRTQKLRDRFEVTIYQMGWRLGGKCATGRGDHGRIEEHGIHGFVGSYYNALGLMHDVYDMLPEATRVGNRVSVGVLSSFEHAFVPEEQVKMWEVRDNNLVSWPNRIFSNRLTPVDYKTSIVLIKQIIDESRNIFGPMSGWDCDTDAETVVTPMMKLFRRRWRWFKALVSFLGLLNSTGLLRSLLLTAIWWFMPFNGYGGGLRRLRRVRLFTNFLLSIRRAMSNCKGPLNEDGFDAIDDIGYRDWLRLPENGILEETLDSALSYNTIDLAYSYPRGDTTQKPRMGAGTYLHWTLRNLLNLGAFIWTFEAGTGETIIAPLYHVLKKNGVRFQFFHKVTDLEPSTDGASIETIHFDRQATLKPGKAKYDPLVWYKDLRSWPNKPKFEDLVEGEELKRRDIEMESYWSDWNKEGAERATSLSRGNDFDKVVFAISIGAVKHICGGILASPIQGERWRRMTEEIPTCQTQTMQIWLDRPSVDHAGPQRRVRLAGDGRPVLSGTFVQPFNGQVDFSSLLKYENWVSSKEGEDDSPNALWYFSGAMAEDGGADFGVTSYPNEQNRRVKYQAIQFLQAAASYVLPDWSTAPWSPLGIDFSLLHCNDANLHGTQRFDKQFWKANIDPTERYVLAPAGTTRHRMKANETGFDNLFVAGDWIYNGLNLGSVEGAVMGGMAAANAVRGKLDIGSGIMGYHHDMPASRAHT